VIDWVYRLNPETMLPAIVSPEQAEEGWTLYPSRRAVLISPERARILWEMEPADSVREQIISHAIDPGSFDSLCDTLFKVIVANDGVIPLVTRTPSNHRSPLRDALRRLIEDGRLQRHLDAETPPMHFAFVVPPPTPDQSPTGETP
jgi:hypothetical protein